MIALLTAALLESSLPTPPPIEREFRAAWVATVDNIDWPSRPGLSVEQQQAELKEIVDTAAELNLNALIFQVRPHGDAMYASKLEPWSYYLTGTQGKAPEPAYDPLETIIKLAHARGIEVHAWFNPYRANHPRQLGPTSADHVTKTHPQYVYRYGNFQWMDPAQEWVQNRSFDVFMDVVERYNVDGIHIDDYFYPYPVTENGRTVPFPDDAVYEAYRQRGGKLGKSDWRRDAVNRFVKRVHEGVKQRKPWVKFGISPFGIYRPGIPAGVTAGIDQYEALHADALLWLQKGWCDYMSPQLYWSIESKGQPFRPLLNWWTSVNSKGIHMWPGLFTSRTDPANPTFASSQIARQVGEIRLNEGSTGHVHFSMKALLRNWAGVADAVKRGNPEPALVPESPWMSKRIPARPTRGDGLTFRFSEDTKFVAYQYSMDGTEWAKAILTSPTAMRPAAPIGAKYLAVTAVDRFSNASRPLVVPMTSTW